MIERLVKWIKAHSGETVILLLILAAGAFLRLYRIFEYMTFLGDEGRDVIIVRRFWVEARPMLIGPGTSIGNMYLGPLYYYLMAPVLLLNGFSPIGPAVQIAILGVVTIFLVWWVGREWFGPIAAVVAAFFYAISPTVIIYSRSSWNPNIMPFFALLSVYLTWRIWQKQEFKLLILLGISYAFVLQSHYLGLLLFPVGGLFWLLTLLKVKKQKEVRKSFLRSTLIGGFIFLLLMSPLVIFDARHGWRNFGAMKEFFTKRQTTVSIRPWTSLPKAWPNFTKVTTRLLAGRNEKVGVPTAAILIVLTLGLVLFRRKTLKTSPDLLLLVWLGVAIAGLGLYKQEIYDHYYGFFFAAPFLWLGAVAEAWIRTNKKVLYPLLFLGLGILAWANLENNPLKYSPNRQLQRSIEIAAFIKEKAGGERFNIATISERNNRDVYEYFLLLWGEKVVDTDPSAVQYTVTDQLFVVCEKPKEKCDPVHDPSAWITNFGWSKILEQWEVAGTSVYKLGHTN